jgi:gliding motility-associated-like protein
MTICEHNIESIFGREGFLLIVCSFIISHSAPAQNLDLGLIVHYPMTGNTIDISTNGLHGLPSNITLATDEYGVSNNAYYFNGIDGFIGLPNNPLVKPDLPVTIACKVKYDTPQIVESTQVFGLDFFQNNYYGIWTNLISGRIEISFGGGAGNMSPSSRRTKQGTTVLNANQWYRITYIIRGPGDMEIYIDCLNDGGNYSGTGPLQVAYSNIPGNVGRMDGNVSLPPYYFKGTLSDFRMWNRELTVFEITYMCNECISNVTSDQSICMGDSVTLSINSTSFIGWVDAAAPQTIISSSPQITVSPLVSLSYLALTPCDTATVHVQVLPSPENISVISSGTLCEADSVNLICQGVMPSDSLMWSNGQTTDNIWVSEPGQYEVTVSNGSCGSQAIGIVEPEEIPLFSFAEPNEYCIGEIFNIGYRLEGADSWSIQPPWINISQSVSFDQSMNLMIIGSATNGCGTTSDSMLLIVNDCNCYIYIPNSVTLNGDHLNESFMPKTECELANYSLEVYDRWGEQLFYTSNIDQGWNGMYKGKPVQVGSYVYKLNFSLALGKSETRIGKVIVIK